MAECLALQLAARDRLDPLMRGLLDRLDLVGAGRFARLAQELGCAREELDEMLAKIDAVEVDQLTELAAELYAADRLSAACVGADEDRFRAALAPVSEALVAA